MNQLFSAGKSFLNKKSDGSGAGGDGGFNPMAMFKSLDKNGDGKITEDGIPQSMKLDIECLSTFKLN
jgi:hypothetical protein